MEPGLRISDFGRVRSSHVSLSDTVFDPVLSFNMRVYRGVVLHSKTSRQTRDVVLGLGPWLSLRTKPESSVLALALNVESLVLSLEKWFWLVSGASLPETMLTEYLQQIKSPTFSQPDSPLPLLCQKFASIKPLLNYILCSPSTSASLPAEVTSSNSLKTFRTKLKSNLFLASFSKLCD